MKAELQDFATLVDLVAHTLLREVDAELLGWWRHPSLRAVAETVHPPVGPWLDSEPSLDDAAVEYCRLFILPKGTSPVLRAWIPGELERHGFSVVESLVDAERRALGTDGAMPPSAPVVPVDHAGRALAMWAAAAKVENTGVFGDATHQISQGLVRFGEALRTSTQHPLYSTVGALVESLSIGEWHEPVMDNAS